MARDWKEVSTTEADMRRFEAPDLEIAQRSGAGDRNAREDLKITEDSDHGSPQRITAQTAVHQTAGVGAAQSR
ncbi:hypothetical protein MRX96_031009 [Rhipicephalus microplus]